MIGVPTSRILGDWPVGASSGLRYPTPEERARALDEFYRQTRGESDMDGSFWRGIVKDTAIIAFTIACSVIGSVVLTLLLSILAAHVTIH